jgi:hypothetical protein
MLKASSSRSDGVVVSILMKQYDGVAEDGFIETISELAYRA